MVLHVQKAFCCEKYCCVPDISTQIIFIRVILIEIIIKHLLEMGSNNHTSNHSRVLGSLQRQYTHTGRECKLELTILRVRDRLDKSEGAQGWKEKPY